MSAIPCARAAERSISSSRCRTYRSRSSWSLNIAQSLGVSDIVSLNGTRSCEPLHHSQQRNVSLGDRFEEPLFLKKMLVLRMPNERQDAREERARENQRPLRDFRVSFQRSEEYKSSLITRKGIRAATSCALPFLYCGCRNLRLRDPSHSLGMTIYSVRQKSWKRSSPFLITSMLVA